MKESDRAETLHALGVMLSAGVDWRQALQTFGVVSPPGMAPARALHRRGWVLDHEWPLLAAMDDIGRIDKGLFLIAARVRGEQATRRAIASGLAFPAAILVLGLMVAPLPALFAGSLTGTGYLLAVLMPLAMLALAVRLAFRHWGRVARALEAGRARLEWPPSITQRIELYRTLAALLDAGMPAKEALGVMARLWDAPLRARLRGAAVRVETGSWPAVLAEQGLVPDRRELAPLLSAQPAGRLPSALSHQADLLAERRRLRREVLVEWAPRLVYGLVLLLLFGVVL